MYHPKSKTFFGGGGLIDIGLINAGIDVVQTLEIDPVCCDTLRLNFNHKIFCQHFNGRLAHAIGREVLVCLVPRDRRCEQQRTAVALLLHLPHSSLRQEKRTAQVNAHNIEERLRRIGQKFTKQCNAGIRDGNIELTKPLNGGVDKRGNYGKIARISRNGDATFR